MPYILCFKKQILSIFTDAIIDLGASKIMHFVDMDNKMLAEIGLIPLQIKRLTRIFNENMVKGVF